MTLSMVCPGAFLIHPHLVSKRPKRHPFGLSQLLFSFSVCIFQNGSKTRYYILSMTTGCAEELKRSLKLFDMNSCICRMLMRHRQASTCEALKLSLRTSNSTIMNQLMNLKANLNQIEQSVVRGVPPWPPSRQPPVAIGDWRSVIGCQ